MQPRYFGIIALLLNSCAVFQQPGSTDQDGPQPSDDSGESDTDTDTDSDTDTDTDTDTGPPLDCSQEPPPQNTLNDCVTLAGPGYDELQCGDTLLSSTAGGTEAFGMDQYEAWYCTFGSSDLYDGLERAFLFTHPGEGTVLFDLDAPCGELDLFVLRWEGWVEDGTCPTAAHLISECEADVDSGDDASVSIFQSAESHYMVIVDSPEEAEELFELSVSCE